MKNYYLTKIFVAAAMVATILVGNVIAQEHTPLVQTNYTADPAPVVFNDTIFLYTTHDEDDADNFKMFDWRLYTSTDMVNWTDRGAVASLKDFPWVQGENGAWAEQVIERNGKYYMYCPIHCQGIGVLMADSPYGPFKDPLGKPLVKQESWYDIDPTVFIDDDGQAYMYWGNPILYGAKLNENMISFDGEITNFGTLPTYQEGPWFFKRNGKYYLAFASTCCPEGIGYAMSEGPMGPWETKGYIMRPTERTRGNHPGVILDYKGKNYVFGLSYDVLRLETPDHHERRSVEGAEMTFNSDGTINEVPYWRESVLNQIEPLNPYKRVEAETMAWGYGLKTSPLNAPNMCVNNISDEKYICVKGVDFGDRGPKSFSASVAGGNGGKIEIRIGSSDGECIGTLNVPASQSDVFKLLTCKVGKVTGVHDLYLCFTGKGDNLFSMDYWEFKK